MATAAQYAAWLQANPQKRGSADYQTVLRAFQEATLEELAAERPTAAPAAKPEGGFFPALRAGATELGGGISALMGKVGLKDEATAQAEYEAAKKRAGEIFKPTEAGWTEAPVTKFLELLGGSAPYMAAPLAAGAAAATLPISGPAAVATTLGAAGLTSAAQFTATNLSRQLEEGKKLADTDLGAAALAAVPQAALDTLSMRMIPGIGRIFGQAGIKVTPETAKEIAEQGLKKTLIDYTAKTGKTAGIEGATEAAQQVFERLQAGLSITDPEARQEYFDSFLGGAVLGGTLAPAGRFVERGREQKEARGLLTAQAAEEKKVARAAEEAEKQTPEYLSTKYNEYQTLLQQKNALDAQIKKGAPGAPLSQDDKDANAVVNKQLNELKKPLEEARQAFLTAGGPQAMAKIKERQRVEGLTPLEYQLEQTETAPIKGIRPGKAPVPVEDTEIFPTIKQSAAEAYAKERIELANEQVFANAQDVKDQPSAYVPYLMQEPRLARELVKNQTPIPGVRKSTSNAILAGLKAKIKELDAEIAKGKSLESSPIAQLEAEERSALEDIAREEAARVAELEARRRLGPELTGLQRMAARPLPESVREEPYLDVVAQRAAAAMPPPKQPSAAIGQMQQTLTGEDITYTAEEPQAPAAPRRVKGTGEFRLYSPPGEEVEGRPAIEKPIQAKDLETRLASALAREDLPQDLYDFLRRVERTLPAQDRQVGLEEQRLKPVRYVTPSGKTIVPETQAAPKSYYGFVDDLLTKIEQTRPAEGAPRRVTTTTQLARAFTPEATAATEEDIDLAKVRQDRFAENLRKGMSRADAAKDAYDYARERQERALKKGAKPETAAARAAEYEAEVRAAQQVPAAGARRLGPPVTVGRGRGALGPETLRGPSAGAVDFDVEIPQEFSLAVASMEQARADTEQQLPLFPEGADKGFILNTADDFKKFLAEKARPRGPGAQLKREQELIEIAKRGLVELRKEIADKEKAIQQLKTDKDALSAARAIVKNNKELAALVKRGETLKIVTPVSVSYIPNAKPALTQAALDKMEVDERIRAIQEVQGARQRVINAASISTEDKTKLLDIAQVYAAELQALEQERASLLAKTDYLLKSLVVEKALNDIQRLSGRPGADAQITQLQQELMPARAALSAAGLTVSRADAAAVRLAAQAQREREAVNRNLAEAERTKRYVAQQEALERREAVPAGRAVAGRVPGAVGEAPTQELGATVYLALTEAQKLSREQPAPRITMVERQQLLGDPQKVISGLESRVTTLANALRNKTDATRKMRLQSLKERKAYDALQAQYTQAKTAAERAALEPRLAEAERAYNEAAQDAMKAVVVWKGYDKDVSELAAAVRKREAIQDLIDSGAFRAAVQPAPKRRLTQAQREAEQAAQQRAAAQEAATRAGAPETTGEALTRTETAKAREAQKTLYQSKGVGAEGRAAAEEARLLREARQAQARGETLTPLQEFLIAEDNRSRVKKEVETDRAARKPKAAEVEEEVVEPTSEELLEEATAAERAAFEAEEAEETGEVKGGIEGVGDLFDTPEGDILQSRGPTANPSTTASLRTELGKVFPDLGRVQIYDSVDALVAANPQYEGKIPSDARGFVDTAGNKAFLIAENVNKGDGLSVLLHEVGAHIGLKNALGDAQYNTLVKAVETWAKKNDGSVESRVAKTALERVEAAKTPANQKADETLAYAIEEAVKAGVKPMGTKGALGQWLSQIATLFRKALEKFGLPPKSLDAQGLVDMAFGAAKLEMRGQGALAPRAQIKAPVSEAFKRWFGNSKVVDAQGKPLVVYHGSNADITAFDPAKLGSATEAASAQLGFFFASEPAVASSYAKLTSGYDKGFIGAMNRFTGGFYEWLNESLLKGISKIPNMRHWEPVGRPVGGNVLPVYLSLKNPLEVDQQGKEYREQSYYDILARAKADGHDGVIIRNTFDEGFESGGNKKTDIYVVFNPTQIKSATGNIGTYDPTNPNILFSRNLPTASRVADSLIAKEKGWVSKLKDNFLGMGFRTQFVDKLAPSEEALKRGGTDPTKALQAMYYLRMYDQRMHFTSQSITEGVPELVEKTRRDGTTERLIETKPGANISQIVDILKAKDVVKAAGSADAANKLFTLYLAAIRAKRVGVDALNFGKGVTQADLDAAMAEIEANDTLKDAFNEARDIYNQYNRNLVDFAVQTGALSKDEANRLLRNNDYIPYYRMRGGVAELIIGNETPIRIGNLKDSPHLKELVGGDEPIMDFLTSSVQNTSMLLDMAMKNLATKNAMFELRDAGLAKIGKTSKKGAPEGSVTFKRDGEDYFAVVDTDSIGISGDLLVKGMAGIPTMFPAFVRAFGMPARFLRRAVVASPVYMARQLFRDTLAATLTSGANITPVLGALNQIGKPDALKNRGITGGQVFTGMPEDMTRMLKEMQAGKISATSGLAWLEAKSAQIDALTRRNQYDSYIKQGLSEMEATYMALESMNFSKRGLSPSLHMASTLIPFFNAQIQGLDVLYKSFTGKMPMNEKLDIQRKLFTRGMLLAGASMAYALAMQDDEAYKNAKPEEKYGNWFLRIPYGENTVRSTGEKVQAYTIVRLPIPFELGYVFKALPEALVNIALNEKGAEEAAKAGAHIARQMVPGLSSYFLPQAVKPALETILNKSFYTGRDIESAQERMVEAGYRYRDNTTQIARELGELTGFSPIQMENLVRGYTGSMGMALLQALSIALPSEGPEKAFKRLSEQPLIGTLFQPNDARGIIDATYQRMKEVQEVQNTYKDLQKKGRPDDARKYAEEKSGELALAAVAGNFRQVMGELSTYERQVRAAPTLSPERKREILDRIRQQQIRIATSARQTFDKSTRQAVLA